MTRYAVAAAVAVALATSALPRAQDAASLARADAPPNGVWLDSLDLTKAPLRRPRLPRGQTGTPPPLVFSLGGTAYAHAVPLLSDGDVGFVLGGNATRFVSMVGLDDTVKAPAGSAIFGVWVDGKKVYDSGVMHGGDAPKLVSIDLAGAKQLVLATNDANDGTGSDTAEWAGAAVIMQPGAQAPTVLMRPAAAQPAIASSRSSAPELNYPRITGATPGRPFLFRIPASGDAPLTFTAKNLPAGLTLDPRTGIVTGTLRDAGRTDVSITIANAKGTTSGTITIVGGTHSLALTPPLGWNSWNVWGGNVTADHVRAAADAMVSSGLAAQGYTYVNIDDAWEAGWHKRANGRNDPNAGRAPDGEILTNEKFPDIKGLVDYIHGKGLKAGIYSGPGLTTCEGLAASYQHEEQDARTWAKWGFDYLKYDWCGYPERADTNSPLELLQKPYILMRGVLDKLDRDIVFSLCQYGWGKVWEWGGQVGGNLWRVTGDINDTWISMSSIGFQQTGHEQYAGPGHWNDTDMLVVGHLGWGSINPPRPTQLTPDEQLTHISLWSLQAAPMLIGADMSQIDDFTRDLLGNREVLAINQDVLGKAAHRISSDGWTEVWSRPLSDGTMAVGLFNRGPEAAWVQVTFSDIGMPDHSPVRFPWVHRDMTTATSSIFGAEVPRHGVILVRIGRAR